MDKYTDPVKYFDYLLALAVESEGLSQAMRVVWDDKASDLTGVDIMRIKTLIIASFFQLDPQMKSKVNKIADFYRKGKAKRVVQDSLLDYLDKATGVADAPKRQRASRAKSATNAQTEIAADIATSAQSLSSDTEREHEQSPKSASTTGESMTQTTGRDIATSMNASIAGKENGSDPKSLGGQSSAESATDSSTQTQTDPMPESVESQDQAIVENSANALTPVVAGQTSRSAGAKSSK